MAALIGLLSVILLALILWDAFETIILPRRVTRRLRLTRTFYRSIWIPWLQIARWMKPGKRREDFLSIFGPLSILMLFGVWALGLVLGFALLQGAVDLTADGPWGIASFRADLYLSGTTFFTLGMGDVTPHTPLARVVTVAEAGTGFGFLAVVISYLPVLYGAFSRREVNISLLDARAGSPPTAAELLRRHTSQQNLEALAEYLRAWETWAAELMESHISYPVLCYFRSQHNNQSWVSALATILDTCALLIAHTEGALRWQAELTFAISRHALVDLAQVLGIPPHSTHADRFNDAVLAELRGILGAAGAPLCKARAGEETLKKQRRMYEPFLFGFSERLLMPLPSWGAASSSVDNWKTSAWGRVSISDRLRPMSSGEQDDHA